MYKKNYHTPSSSIYTFVKYRQTLLFLYLAHFLVVAWLISTFLYPILLTISFDIEHMDGKYFDKVFFMNLGFTNFLDFLGIDSIQYIHEVSETFKIYKIQFYNLYCHSLNSIPYYYSGYSTMLWYTQCNDCDRWVSFPLKAFDNHRALYHPIGVHLPYKNSQIGSFISYIHETIHVGGYHVGLPYILEDSVSFDILNIWNYSILNNIHNNNVIGFHDFATSDFINCIFPYNEFRKFIRPIYGMFDSKFILDHAYINPTAKDQERLESRLGTVFFNVLTPYKLGVNPNIFGGQASITAPVTPEGILWGSYFNFNTYKWQHMNYSPLSLLIDELRSQHINKLVNVFDFICSSLRLYNNVVYEAPLSTCLPYSLSLTSRLHLFRYGLWPVSLSVESMIENMEQNPEYEGEIRPGLLTQLFRLWHPKHIYETNLRDVVSYEYNLGYDYSPSTRYYNLINSWLKSKSNARYKISEHTCGPSSLSLNGLYDNFFKASTILQKYNHDINIFLAYPSQLSLANRNVFLNLNQPVYSWFSSPSRRHYNDKDFCYNYNPWLGLYNGRECSQEGFLKLYDDLYKHMSYTSHYSLFKQNSNIHDELRLSVSKLYMRLCSAIHNNMDYTIDNSITKPIINSGLLKPDVHESSGVVNKVVRYVCNYEYEILQHIFLPINHLSSYMEDGIDVLVCAGRASHPIGVLQYGFKEAYLFHNAHSKLTYSNFQFLNYHSNYYNAWNNLKWFIEIFRIIIVSYLVAFFIFIIIVVFHIVYAYEFLLNDYIECRQFRKVISYLLLVNIIIYTYICLFNYIVSSNYGCILENMYIAYHEFSTDNCAGVNYATSLDEYYHDVLLFHYFISSCIWLDTCGCMSDKYTYLYIFNTIHYILIYLYDILNGSTMVAQFESATVFSDYIIVSLNMDSTTYDVYEYLCNSGTRNTDYYIIYHYFNIVLMIYLAASMLKSRPPFKKYDNERAILPEMGTAPCPNSAAIKSDSNY